MNQFRKSDTPSKTPIHGLAFRLSGAQMDIQESRLYRERADGGKAKILVLEDFKPQLVVKFQQKLASLRRV